MGPSEVVVLKTLQPAECVVVDDGSSDDTRAIADRHPACTTFIARPNGGVSDARNAGAAKARGSLLAFLDADDVWLPERLERVARRMAINDAQAVLRDTWIADEALQAQRRLAISDGLTAEQMLLGWATLVASNSNLLIERDALVAVGGFDESLSTSTDWHLTFRILDQLRWIREPTALTLYRQHAHGMSNDVDRMARDMLAVYRESFATCEPRAAVERSADCTAHSPARTLLAVGRAPLHTTQS
ncbi:MAG: glycosyltransferase family 2 protein [Solirubrobacteraceae bacterium]